MVVNLYYSEPHIHNVQGFGYLIPRSVPYAQNPEMALGVVFDSDSAPVDTAPGTKLTVMLGGHYWSHLSPDELPTEEEGIDMARAVLARHLKITEKPEATACSLQRDCIPQYTVGHSAELKEINRSLNSLSDGRLAVAGAWTDGVGLNDCAVSGMRAADETVNGINPNYMNEYHGGPMKWTASSAVGRGTFPPAFQALVNRMRRR